jgi:hypothetical protein
MLLSGCLLARAWAALTATSPGRGGEVEINENGTKTMKTGGTKTLYSWRDGGIVSTTEGAYFVSRPCKCSSKSLAIFSKIFVFRIPGSDALAF